MAERPELRNIANSNGDSIMRISDSRRASSSEGVFVLGGAANSAETGRSPVGAGNASAGRDVDPHAGVRGSLQPADSRAARLAAMSAKDREVFNLWARRVGVLDSLIIVGLVMAMLLVSHPSTEQKADVMSPAAGHVSSVASVPDLGRTGK
jgi:hypothetical protein